MWTTCIWKNGTYSGLYLFAYLCVIYKVGLCLSLNANPLLAILIQLQYGYTHRCVSHIRILSYYTYFNDINLHCYYHTLLLRAVSLMFYLYIFELEVCIYKGAKIYHGIFIRVWIIFSRDLSKQFGCLVAGTKNSIF